MSQWLYFTDNEMLWSAFLALIPLVILLIKKKKAVPVAWGAMIFLRKEFTDRAKRLKKYRFILFFLRSFFFILLALAMSRPIVGKHSSHTRTDREQTMHVLIIDLSASTQQGDGLISVAEKIKKQSLAVVDLMEDGDKMYVIYAKETPQLLAPFPQEHPFILKQHIEGLVPTNQRSNLMNSLLRATDLLATAKETRQVIYVVTDEQANNWQASSSKVWSSYHERIKKSNIKPEVYLFPETFITGLPNIQVFDFKAKRSLIHLNSETEFHVMVRNPGVSRDVELQFYINNALSFSKRVSLISGVNEISLTALFKSGGEKRLKVTLQDDMFLLDNNAHLIVNVPATISCLLLKKIVDDGKKQRLSLIPNTWKDGGSDVSLSVMNEIEFDTLTDSEISGYNALILEGVLSFSLSSKRRLEAYVRNGGGLFVILSEEVESQQGDFSVKGESSLFPYTLDRLIPLKSADSQITQPLLFDYLPTGEKASLSPLSQIRIRAVYSMISDEISEIMGRVGTHPLLARYRLGRGQVLYWLAPHFQMRNEKAFSEAYLFFMKSLLMDLSRDSSIFSTVDVGESITLEFELGKKRDEGLKHSMAQLREPSGRLANIGLLENAGLLQGTCLTKTLGIYSAVLGRSTHHYAVNLDANEGDLTPIASADKKRILSLLKALPYASAVDVKKSLHKRPEKVELFYLFIFLGCVVLVIEPYLSWRVSR